MSGSLSHPSPSPPTAKTRLLSLLVGVNSVRTRKLDPCRVYFLIPFIFIFLNSTAESLLPSYLYTFVFISWYAGQSLIAYPTPDLVSRTTAATAHGMTNAISTIESDQVFLIVVLVWQLTSVCLAVSCFWVTTNPFASFNIALVLLLAITVDTVAIAGVFYAAVTNRMKEFAVQYFTEYTVVHVENDTLRTIQKPFTTTTIVLESKWTHGSVTGIRDHENGAEYVLQDIQLEGDGIPVPMNDLL